LRRSRHDSRSISKRCGIGSQEINSERYALGARRVRVLRTDLDRFLAATGATALPDPSQDERAAVHRNEELAAALQRARAALAADRKTDLAIALHTLVAAADPFLNSQASHERRSGADDQVSEAAPTND
jgi:hypothetical protein